MSHVFRAESFIAPPTAKKSDGITTVYDGRGNESISELVENYLTENDAGGTGRDIDEVLSVTSCTLSGGRIFVLIVIEDDVPSG